jgi:hypothetical protein
LPFLSLPFSFFSLIHILSHLQLHGRINKEHESNVSWCRIEKLGILHEFHLPYPFHLCHLDSWIPHCKDTPTTFGTRWW